jgi:hypothetical protein
VCLKRYILSVRQHSKRIWQIIYRYTKHISFRTIELPLRLPCANKLMISIFILREMRWNSMFQNGIQTVK